MSAVCLQFGATYVSFTGIYQKIKHRSGFPEELTKMSNNQKRHEFYLTYTETEKYFLGGKI